MKKYSLSCEKDNINLLIEDLSKILKVDISLLADIEEDFYRLILNNRDACLEDILKAYYSLLEQEMMTLMDKRVTPAMQFGIKNDLFFVGGYGGNYNGNFNSKEIDWNTYFSFDSISKVLSSVLMMTLVREGNISFNSTVCSYNSEFDMDASIESILKFTAMIQTDKRIDNLSRDETIEILKKCKENINEKELIRNFYQYNDIGYMILRLSIPDFLARLDNILNCIDADNLTYKNGENKDKITGGKLGEEYVTPDTKGRGILFPGHTGLYGNMEGLLSIFDKVFYGDKILTHEERDILLRQPYDDPIVYTKEGKQLVGKNNSLQYIAKVAGVYRKPYGINNVSYDKLASCDFSNLTTDRALASAGTCGSWVMGDNLTYKNRFGTYVGGILTNPYSYVKTGIYPNNWNSILNTGLIVNQKGIILGYSGLLDPYKEIIAKYGILLELLTEYIKSTYKDVTLDKKYSLVRKI